MHLPEPVCARSGSCSQRMAVSPTGKHVSWTGIKLNSPPLDDLHTATSVNHEEFTGLSRTVLIGSAATVGKARPFRDYRNVNSGSRLTAIL